jgi:type II secretory pathway pseudopilin PulG
MIHPIPPSGRTSSRGFTLLEVLGALALCVLLAGVAASATIQSSSALRRTEALQDQALRLRALHAQARLHPAGLADAAVPSPASPWLVAMEERLVPAPPPPKSVALRPGRPASPPPPRRWTVLTLHDSTGTLRPVQLEILEPAP